MEKRIIACASDHAGFEIKDAIKQTLLSWGYNVLDLGTHSSASVDYPDFAEAMAKAFAKHQIQTGVLACVAELVLPWPPIGLKICAQLCATRPKNLAWLGSIMMPIPLLLVGGL